MKRSILFMLALTLIGSTALAQGSPSGESPTPGAKPPTEGSPSVEAPTSGSAGVTAVVPVGVYRAYGTSSGVQRIEDAYATRAAAARFGTPQGVVSPQAPSGAGSATQQPR